MPGPSNTKKSSKSKGKRRAVVVRSSEEPLEAPPVIAAPPIGSTSQLQPPPPYRTRGSTRGRPLRTLELVDNLEEEFESLLPYLDPEAELPDDDDLHTRLLLKIATVAPLLVRLFFLIRYPLFTIIPEPCSQSHRHLPECRHCRRLRACLLLAVSYRPRPIHLGLGPPVVVLGQGHHPRRAFRGLSGGWRACTG